MYEVHAFISAYSIPLLVSAFAPYRQEGFRVFQQFTFLFNNHYWLREPVLTSVTCKRWFSASTMTLPNAFLNLWNSTGLIILPDIPPLRLQRSFQRVCFQSSQTHLYLSWFHPNYWIPQEWQQGLGQSATDNISHQPYTGHQEYSLEDWRLL